MIRRKTSTGGQSRWRPRRPNGRPRLLDLAIARTAALARRSAGRLSLRNGLIALSVLFAVASVFFYGKLRESAVLVNALVRTSTRGVPEMDTEARAQAVAREVFRRTNREITPGELPLYERLESTSVFNVTSSVSLEYGIFGVTGHSQVGPCGTMTRVTLEALHQLGIPARKLQLLEDESGHSGGHTMLEFRSRGRWLVISPSDQAFVWRRPDGAIATLEEIRANPAIYAQIFELYPNYPYDFRNPRHIRWAKLPPVVRAGFRRVLGQRGYDEALTPRLYDQPRELFLYGSLVAFLGAGLAALLVAKPGRPKAESAAVWPSAA
jgi:hypothetical protein